MVMLTYTVLGTDNPADCFTKYLDPASMSRALAKMNVVFMEGRPDCAPAAMGIPKVASTDETSAA